MEVGEEEDYKMIPIATLHHQNDSCIKMSSDESHFKVSLTVRNKVTRLSTNHNPFEEKGEPKRNRAVALLLTSLMPYR